MGHTRSSETYWRVAAVVDELNGVVEQAWSYIADGDARNALDILEVFTDEFVTSWQKLDTSDGEIGDLVYEVGASVDRGDPVRRLARRRTRALEQSAREVAADGREYGVADAFSAAIAAAEEGWHSWSLQRVMEG